MKKIFVGLVALVFTISFSQAQEFNAKFFSKGISVGKAKLPASNVLIEMGDSMERRAIILPRVIHHDSINNPQFGMFVFDRSDSSLWVRLKSSWTKVAGGPGGTELDPQFDIKFSGKSTTQLPEGLNQYFTQQRARNSVSGSSSTFLNYNPSTGVFSLDTLKLATLSQFKDSLNMLRSLIGAGANASNGARVVGGFIQIGGDLINSVTKIKAGNNAFELNAGDTALSSGALNEIKINTSLLLRSRYIDGSNSYIQNTYSGTQINTFDNTGKRAVIDVGHGNIALNPDDSLLLSIKRGSSPRGKPAYYDTATKKIFYTDETAGSANFRQKRQSDGVLLDSTNAASKVVLADTLFPGVMSAADKKKFDRTEQVASEVELRTIGPDRRRIDIVYEFIKSVGSARVIGQFYWDPTSTDVDDTSMTIKVAGVTTGRFKRYVENEIHSLWFGADPTDNGLPKNVKLQKGIDWCVKYKSHGTYVIDPGIYNIAKGLLVRNNEDNLGNSDFVSLDIRGAKKGGDNDMSIGGFTVLRLTDSTGFCLAIEKGKNCEISNISFSGLNYKPLTEITPLNMGADSVTWVTPGLADTRIRQHAAIVLDPFGNAAIPEAARYPQFIDHYTEISGSGCSFINIHDCTFQYFVVGIMNSGNGYTQNGEGHNFHDLYFTSIKSCIANGNSQNRTVTCTNINAWSGIEVVFDCRRYGDATGSSFIARTVNTAGAVKWLVCSGNFGIGDNNVFQDVHFESTGGIGGDIINHTANGGNITITNGAFALAIEGTDYSKRSPIAVWCKQLTLKDMFFGYYENGDPTAVGIYAKLYHGEGVTGNDVINYASSNNSTVFERNSAARGFRELYDVSEAGETFSVGRLYPGMVVKKDIDLNGTIRSTYTGNTMNVYSLPNQVTYLGHNHAANIDTFSCNPADYFMISNSVSGLIAMSGGSVITGLMGSIGSNKFIVASAHHDVDYIPGAQGYMSLYQVPYFNQRPNFMIGDYTTGSNKIRNILVERVLANYITVGQYYNNPSFPVGTWVTAVAGDSITLSANATRTEAGAFVSVEYAWQQIGYGGENMSTLGGFYGKVAWKEGDEILNNITPWNTTIDTATYKFICVKAGMGGTAHPPVFKKVKLGSGGGVGGGSYTPPAVNLTGIQFGGTGRVSVTDSVRLNYDSINNIVTVRSTNGAKYAALFLRNSNNEYNGMWMGDPSSIYPSEAGYWTNAPLYNWYNAAASAKVMTLSPSTSKLTVNGKIQAGGVGVGIDPGLYGLYIKKDGVEIESGSRYYANALITNTSNAGFYYGYDNISGEAALIHYPDLKTVGYNGSAFAQTGKITGLGDWSTVRDMLIGRNFSVTGTSLFTGKVTYGSHPTINNDLDLVDRKFVNDSLGNKLYDVFKKAGTDSLFKRTIAGGVQFLLKLNSSPTSATLIDSLAPYIAFDTLKSIYTTGNTPVQFDSLYVPVDKMIEFDITIMYHDIATNAKGSFHQRVWVSNSAGVYDYQLGTSDGFNDSGVLGVYIGYIQFGSTVPPNFEIAGLTSKTLLWTLQRSPRIHSLTSL